MKKLLLLLLPVMFLACKADGQMTVRVVRDSLFIPWEIAYGPDNHIWFTQKNGYICRLNPGSRKIDTLYHETNTVIQAEGGMLGLALHPSFPTTPAVYVAYNYLAGSAYKERIVKYEYTGTALQNPQTILDNIDAANFHNGCRLVANGNYLYITTGDATATSNSQNTSVINGKILRLMLDGSIPTDNPIPGSAVWSWGHRNAQGLVMVNGKLFESEHGSTTDDEINIIQKGRNFGWPNVEGFCDKPSETTFCTNNNVAEPLKAWTPTIAVCGIDYYDNPMFPAFRNSLIMATLKDSRLYRLKLNAGMTGIDSTLIISSVSYGRLRDVCISPEGRIYVSTSNSTASGTGTRVDKIIEIYDPSFTGTAISKENIDNDIKVYPNPATNELHIQVKDIYQGNISYNITNTLGQRLSAGNLTNNINTISLEYVPNGVYNIRIMKGYEILYREKLLKQ